MNRFIPPSFRVLSSRGLGLALEEGTDRQTQAGEKRAPLQLIAGRQDAQILRRIVNVYLPVHGQDDPDLLDAQAKILAHFGEYVLEDIVGADDLNGEIGN